MLQLSIHLVQIKGLRIKLAPDPFQHLLVLGVLGIVDGFQETDISPDATAILGGTGPFAREADRVALPLIQLTGCKFSVAQTLYPSAQREGHRLRRERCVEKNAWDSE